MIFWICVCLNSFRLLLSIISLASVCQDRLCSLLATKYNLPVFLWVVARQGGRGLEYQFASWHRAFFICSFRDSLLSSFLLWLMWAMGNISHAACICSLKWPTVFQKEYVLSALSLKVPLRENMYQRKHAYVYYVLLDPSKSSIMGL